MRTEVRHQGAAGATVHRERCTTPAAYPLPSSTAPALLSEEQAAAFFGVSVRKFAALRHEAWMPAAIPLGPRLLKFSRQELEAAIALMPRQERPGNEPAALAKSRADRSKLVGGAAS